MNIANTIKLATMGFKPADIKRFNGSSISDDQIIKLAESGYSAKDVDELIALTQEQPESVQPEKTAPTEQEPASAPAPEGDPAGDDYKEKFETQSKELEEKQKTIESLRAQLTHKDLGKAEVEKPEESFKKALMSIY